MPCRTGLPPCNSALLMSQRYMLPYYSLHSSPPSSPQFVSFPLCFCSLLFRTNCRHYITCFSLLKGWADTVKNSSNSNKKCSQCFVTSIWHNLVRLYLRESLWHFCYLLAQVQLVTLNVPWSEVKMWRATGLCFKSRLWTRLHLTLLPSFLLLTEANMWL